MNKISVHQVLPHLGAKDAIGNEVLLMQDFFRKWGYESEIFVTEGAYEGSSAYFLSDARFVESDLFIHHFSIGSSLPFELAKMGVPQVLRYHNITPHYYFKHPHQAYAYSQCLIGALQRGLAQKSTFAIWGASAFNLEDFPATENKEVLPVLRDYACLAAEIPDNRILELFSNVDKVALYVGRITPHKAVHDLLFYAAQVKKLGWPFKLVLVGSKDEAYWQDVFLPISHQLGLTLCFPLEGGGTAGDLLCFENIGQKELASLYHRADVFMSASDHEGFCVPLVEAFAFGLPSLVHAAAALPETAGDGALLFVKDEPSALLQALADLLWDREKRTALSQRALERAKVFDLVALESRLRSLLDDAINRLAPTR